MFLCQCNEETNEWHYLPYTECLQQSYPGGETNTRSPEFSAEEDATKEIKISEFHGFIEHAEQTGLLKLVIIWHNLVNADMLILWWLIGEEMCSLLVNLFYYGNINPFCLQLERIRSYFVYSIIINVSVYSWQYEQKN